MARIRDRTMTIALGDQREDEGVPQGEPEDGILQRRAEVPQADETWREGSPVVASLKEYRTARTKGTPIIATM